MGFKSSYRAATVKTAPERLQSGVPGTAAVLIQGHLLPHQLRRMIPLPLPLTGGRTLAEASTTGAGETLHPPDIPDVPCEVRPSRSRTLPTGRNRADRSRMAKMSLSVPGASGRARSTKGDFRCLNPVRAPAPEGPHSGAEPASRAAPALAAPSRDIFHKPEAET